MDATWWKKTSELDQTQQDIIQLDLDGNYLITGPPGSGKTNILLLRASYLNSAGLQNCVLLTYTRHLREFIVSGGKIPSAWVKTLAAWCRLFLRERGVDMAELKEELEDTNEPEARQLLVTRVRDELAKISDPRNFYDSVLIDEIQDYTPVEIELMASLSPRLYVVGDEQQRIFAASGAIQAALKAGCERKVITAHYRMGRAICEVADKLMPGSNLSGASYYDEKELPSEVRVHTGDQAAQLKQLAETLKLQIKTFPGQWFGVLAAKWATLEAAETYFDANGLEGLYKVQRGDEDRAYDPECPICIMTIQSAKGGEFRGVHLLSADIFPYFTREKAYTAITRAKTTLDVYHESNMAAPLQSALAKRRVPKLDLDEA